MPSKPLFQVFTVTAGDDNPFQLTTLSIWMVEVDIFITTHDALIGDVTDQTLGITAGDVYTVKGPVCLKDFFFKNAGAGNNTVVTLAGTTLSDNQLSAMGIL